MMTSYFRMIKVLVAQDEYHQGTSCDLELQDNCILYFTRIYWLYLLHVTSTPAKLDWYSQIGIYRINNKHKRSLIRSRQTTTICSQPSLSSLKRQYSRSHCTTAECFSPHHEPWSNFILVKLSNSSFGRNTTPKSPTCRSTWDWSHHRSSVCLVICDGLFALQFRDIADSLGSQTSSRAAGCTGTMQTGSFKTHLNSSVWTSRLNGENREKAANLCNQPGGNLGQTMNVILVCA